MGIAVNAEIAGKLRLIKPLGEGSAGHVWLAKHLHLGSQVAVKFLHRDVAADETGRERFAREARTVARLRSPHIVQVHDFGFHEERAYLVMEYLVGETLESRLSHRGALPAIEVARVCTQIAKALQKAHDAGVVHRDIKPANVFLVDYGDEEVAKVVDFGIVKAIDAPIDSANLAASSLEVLTQTGSLLGTPYYMSPEQIEDSGAVGHTSDLWSLGVITFESLVGKHPFGAPNFAQLVMAICRNPLPVPSEFADVPRDFDAWFARALQRDPTERFQSARDMAGELCHALVFHDSDISMLRGSVPPDLFWSGMHPSFAPVTTVVNVGSDRPAALENEASASGEYAKTLVCRPSTPEIEERDAAALRKVEVLEANLTSSGDGSLGSQVASKPEVTAHKQNLRRTALLALAAVVLVAAGWIASQMSTAGLTADAQDSGPASALSVASPAFSSSLEPSSSTTAPAQSTATTVESSAEAGATVSATASSVAPPSPPPIKTVPKKPRVPTPPPPATSTVREDAEPPRPKVDLDLRQ